MQPTDQLTEVLVKFIRRNLEDLDAWRHRDDKSISWFARGCCDEVVSSVEAKSVALGFPELSDRPDEVFTRLKLVKLVADAGQLRALTVLLETAKLSAAKLQALERKWLREKPATHCAQLIANAKASLIGDGDVNRMLRTVENKITESGDDNSRGATEHEEDDA